MKRSSRKSLVLGGAIVESVVTARGKMYTAYVLAYRGMLEARREQAAKIEWLPIRFFFFFF